jgi:N-acetyl-anhydromuramyl-L-alanine amidase AmpD
MADGVGGTGSSGNSSSSAHAASSGPSASSHASSSQAESAHAQSTACTQTHDLGQAPTQAQSLACASTPGHALATAPSASHALANAATTGDALTQGANAAPGVANAPTGWHSMAQAASVPASKAPHALGQWQTMATGAAQSVFHDGSIAQQSFKNLENGPLPHDAVHGIVLHRTDSATAQQTLNGYKNARYGAHYLVDTNGDITQTVPTDKKAQHVGQIRSKAEEQGTLSAAEQQQIDQIQAKNKNNFGNYVKGLHKHEVAKAYPDRYPYNADSIGIEVVGRYDPKTKAFEPATKAQLDSVHRLVEGLKTSFGLTNADVYQHGQISYKDPGRTEGSGLGY